MKFVYFMIFTFLICIVTFALVIYYFWSDNNHSAVYFNENDLAGKKIWIFGFSGNGKSTLAKKLSYLLNLKSLSMDQVRFKEESKNFQTKPSSDIIQLVNDFIQENKSTGWIIESSSQHTDLILVKEADVIIWLDLPYSQILYRIAKRSFLRCWHKTHLFGTQNQEFFSVFLKFWNPDSMLYWATRRYKSNVEYYNLIFHEPTNSVHFKITSQTVLDKCLSSFSMINTLPNSRSLSL